MRALPRLRGRSGGRGADTRRRKPKAACAQARLGGGGGCVWQVPFVNRDLVLDTRAFSTRTSLHTLDGVLSLLVLLRAYHTARWLRAALFARYDSRRFASRLADQPAGAVLAVRIVVLDSPLRSAAAAAVAVILVFSYLYRVAESRSQTLPPPAAPTYNPRASPQGRAGAEPARSARAQTRGLHGPTRRPGLTGPRPLRPAVPAPFTFLPTPLAAGPVSLSAGAFGGDGASRRRVTAAPSLNGGHDATATPFPVFPAVEHPRAAARTCSEPARAALQI